MKFNEKGPEKLAVTEYEFNFLGGKGVMVQCWTGKGDTVEFDKEMGCWHFFLESAKPPTEQLIFKENILGMSITETTKVFVTVQDASQRLREKRRLELERQQEEAEKRQQEDEE